MKADRGPNDSPPFLRIGTNSEYYLPISALATEIHSTLRQQAASDEYFDRATKPGPNQHFVARGDPEVVCAGINAFWYGKNQIFFYISPRQMWSSSAGRG